MTEILWIAGAVALCAFLMLTWSLCAIASRTEEQRRQEGRPWRS